jgi:3-keto-disaccharide hydrolase
MSRPARTYVAPLVALTLALTSPAALRAAEPVVAPPTGDDYILAGEYGGEVHIPAGDETIGVQVFPLGGGKFSAVTYIGGLPGAGWDHSPRRVNAGQVKDGTLDFSGEGYTGKVKDGVVRIGLLGVNIAELKKIERKSDTLGAKPPEGAVVLFDGSSADKFEGGKVDEEGLLLPGCSSKEKFGSGKLHVEFRVPLMVDSKGQARGNSGVYLQGRYEVQVLDSFGLEESDTGGGAIYGVRAPDQNMCYPPFAWQTYDIDFTAPEYKDGATEPTAPATMQVKQNGVMIHKKARLTAATTSAPVAAGPEPGPVYLQDHGTPVRFRNIWFAPKVAEKPVEKAEVKN